MPHSARLARPCLPPRRLRASRPGAAFTLVEIVIALTLIGLMLAMGLPRLDLTRYRADAAVQNLRSVLMQAQRTALLRQYDVVITIDTVNGALKTFEDANNDGIIQSSEHKRTYTLSDGMTFATPVTGLDSAGTPAVSGAQLGSLNALPSVTFHRDGAASSDLQLYLASPAGPNRTWRAIRLTQSTGRSDWYRYNVKAGTWVQGGLQ
jgi:type II secretory pathway pseudopilin PulG